MTSRRRTSFLQNYQPTRFGTRHALTVPNPSEVLSQTLIGGVLSPVYRLELSEGKATIVSPLSTEYAKES